MIARLKIVAARESEDISRALTSYLSDLPFKTEPEVSCGERSPSTGENLYAYRGLPGIPELLTLTGAALANATVLRGIFDALRATVTQFRSSSIDFEFTPPNGSTIVIKGDHLRCKTAQECWEFYREVLNKCSATVS